LAWLLVAGGLLGAAFLIRYYFTPEAAATIEIGEKPEIYLQPEYATESKIADEAREWITHLEVKRVPDFLQIEEVHFSLEELRHSDLKRADMARAWATALSQAKSMSQESEVPPSADRLSAIGFRQRYNQPGCVDLMLEYANGSSRTIPLSQEIIAQ